MTTTPPEAPGPQPRPLTPDEIRAILDRNRVGRLAYARDNRIEVAPIHYVHAGGCLFARTSRGEKHRLLAQSFYHIWPVAFEVDEVEDLFRWRSVVVHGSAYLVRPPWEGGTEADWAQAVEALRRLLPAAFTPADPTPERSVVFRIPVQEASGYESLPPA